TSIPLSPEVENLDRQAFGADRRELLSILSQIESKAMKQGYAMARAGSKASYFGPCVAENSGEATQLVDWFLEQHKGETIYWDLLPDNVEAVRIATGRGFQPLRRLVRMAIPRPKPFEHDDSMVYAIAGFEFG